MSIANNKWIKLQQVAGIGLLCCLAATGCSRSDKDDKAEVIETTAEQPVVNNDTVAPAINCDDPMVQDRLKAALKNTLNQQAQKLAASYASDAGINLSSATVSSKVNTVLIDVQNAAVLQEANANGMTTCQASVSMTLPSEDLYQASQIQAANNQPSLQTRLAEDNIRINNNMLIDNAFSYVVSTQGGQVRTRIAGQPALITVVADVMAGSALKSAVDSQSTQRRAQESAPANSGSQAIRQPTPVAPVRPAQPATPPTINQNSGNQSGSSQNSNDQSSNQSAATSKPSTTAPATPEPPKSTPKDESIDMVIIEDENATY